ncbi:MAG: hypothetical protein AABX29_04210 [Nanoarchaeota archaeon]
MERERFMQSEFWKRFNRAKRFEKRLILEGLQDILDKGLPISRISDNRHGVLNPGEFYIFCSEQEEDFSQVIEHSRKVNFPLYRKYEEDVNSYKEIFNNLSRLHQDYNSL